IKPAPVRPPAPARTTRTVVTPPARRPAETRPAPEPRSVPAATAAPDLPPSRPGPETGGLLPVPSERLAAYGRLVWTRIERRKPRDVHSPGIATITFALAADGTLLSASLGASSSVASLDRAALAAVAAAAPFPAAPAGATPAQLIFTIPFQFR
ncbi:MAG: TonB family protein, partial [Rhodospirillaceae bacterium]